MLINRAMKEYWQKQTRVNLPTILLMRLESRFIEVYGSIVLESMLPDYLKPEPFKESLLDLPENLKQTFQNKTGFEHFVSKTHIDGIVQERHFDYALEFLTRIFERFRKQYSDGPVLRGIISVDTGSPPDSLFSCCVSYHVKREGESWLSPDIDSNEIEKYNEALLVIDSDEKFLAWGSQS